MIREDPDIYIVDFPPGMGPARYFCQCTNFTFGTEQPVVTFERIRLQDTPEGKKVLPPCIKLCQKYPANLFAPEMSGNISGFLLKIQHRRKILLI